MKLESDLISTIENLHQVSDYPLTDQLKANKYYDQILESNTFKNGTIAEIDEEIQIAADNYMRSIYPAFKEKYGKQADFYDILTAERKRFVYNIFVVPRYYLVAIKFETLTCILEDSHLSH